MAEYIRVGDTLTNILDSITGEWSTYYKVTTKPDGTLIDDTFVGQVTPIFRKLGAEYFKRVFIDGLINVKWFGAIGNNIADDTLAIQRAANVTYAVRQISTLSPNVTLYFPSDNVFRTTDTINIPENINVRMDTRINYNGPKDRPAIIIGSTSASINTTLKLSVASTPRLDSNWDNINHTGIKLINQFASETTIDIIDGFYKGLECIGNGTGFAYNKIYLKQLNNNRYHLYLDKQNTGGYCNQNKFFGGRFSTGSTFGEGITRVGARMIGDSNTMYSPSFELDWLIARPGYAHAAIMDDGSIGNSILDCRSEGNSALNLSTSAPAFIINGSSYNNYIEVTYAFDRQRAKEANSFQDNSTTKQNRYVSKQNLYAEAQFGRTVFDTGNLAEKATRYDGTNQIIIPDIQFISYNSNTISPFSPSDVTAEILNKGNGSYVELLRTGFAVKLSTDFAKKFAVIRDGLQGRGGRIGIKCYDINNTEITSETNWLLDSQVPNNNLNQEFIWSTNYGGCYITQGTGISNIPVYFSVKEEVKSILFFVGNPSGLTALKSFKILSLDNEAKNTTNSYSQTFNDNLNRINTNIPTVGTFNTGKILFRRAVSNGQGLIVFCTKYGTAHNLSDTGNVTAGNSTITNITNIAQFNVGDYVLVQNATGPQYTISRIDTTNNTITLNTSTGLVTGNTLAITNDPPQFRESSPLNIDFSGTTSPEGVITAPVGAVYHQLGNVIGSPLWVKLTGTGNTGWVEVQTTKNGPTSQRPVNPSVGYMYFNTSASDSGPEWWDGTAWVRAFPVASTTRIGAVRQGAAVPNGSSIDTLLISLRNAGIIAT